MASSIVITKKGGPEVLSVKSLPDPTPADGEVVIEVKASGINFADIVCRMGLYPNTPRMPFIPGFEASGVVVESRHDTFSAGDRVVGMRTFGAQSSRVSFDHGALLRIPDDMSFEQAAAIPVNYVTAYYALHNLANLKEGETVLIHSAAGGVGTAACQLALRSGATVIGVAGSEVKIDYLKRLGVHHAINRRTSDFAAVVRQICPDGVDIILDPVGGKTFRANLKLLTAGGRIIAYGVAELASYGKFNLVKVVKQVLTFPKVRVVEMMTSNIGVCGFNLTGLARKKKLLSEVFEKVMSICSNGETRPHIDKVYKPEQIAEAHRYMQSGESLGKLVINWN